MSDIVERLLADARCEDVAATGVDVVLIEAALEIERLRKQLNDLDDEWRAWVDNLDP